MTDRHDVENSKTPEYTLTRRGFMQVAGGTAIALGVGGCATGTPSPQPTVASGDGGFRFAFMPDIHLRREFDSPKGMATALRAVEALNPKPAFIVTGGDQFQNLRDQGLDDATELADLFVRIWRDNTNLPTYHCLGNHDAAGWRKGDFPRDHPLFGFNLPMRKLGMDRPFYSFDHGGWHFVVLCNFTLVEPGSYVNEFTPEQMTFLRNDLAQAGHRPTILFGHMPPHSAIEFFDGAAKHDDEQREWRIRSVRMTRNPIDLIDAIEGHNVKAFFSGHIHRLDRVQAMGLDMICAGSVSGAQWTGPQRETPPGIAVIDCHADGRFDYEYHVYGWESRA